MCERFIRRCHNCPGAVWKYTKLYTLAHNFWLVLFMNMPGIFPSSFIIYFHIHFLNIASWRFHVMSRFLCLKAKNNMAKCLKNWKEFTHIIYYMLLNWHKVLTILSDNFQSHKNQLKLKNWCRYQLSFKIIWVTNSPIRVIHPRPVPTVKLSRCLANVRNANPHVSRTWVKRHCCWAWMILYIQKN